MISSRIDVTVPQASTLADTGLSVFYRTIADRGYRQVARQLPDLTLRYRYGGPRDKLTRPVCRTWLAHEPFTRDAIDQLSNGQIPNVWLTCGGYRCRHQWIMVVE